VGYLGLRCTNTTISEKGKRIRGYKFETAKFLVRSFLDWAHSNMRFEETRLWDGYSSSSSLESSAGAAVSRLLRYSVATGARSPPSRPSQSAYNTGVSERELEGSRYRCTFSDVGTSPPEFPTTGNPEESMPGIDLKRIKSLIRVLLPAPLWPTKETRLGVRREAIAGDAGKVGESLPVVDRRLYSDSVDVAAISSANLP
jgi:hypothetical protein